jgi:hypothetical protein
MSTRSHWASISAVAFLWLLTCAPANAVCLITSITSVTPSTANAGTYTAPVSPTAQPININVQGVYLAVLGGTCSVGISFNRASLPASMAISGGGSATLPYTIRSLSGGGNTLLYVGSGIPGAANRLETTFAVGPLVVPGNFSVNLTAYVLMQPGPTQQGGTYSDSITLDVFADLLIIPFRAVASPFTVQGTVTSMCTIGGVATPTADSATIPVSGGVVNTTPILKTYSNVVCNSPSRVQLTSQSGAVKSATPAPGSFSNHIDYSASAVFSGATATVNTATVPTATGPEASTSILATGSMPSGTLSVTITPQTSALPLVKGSYADTLRVTITPD